jgi:predicted metal-dependent hydrolase
MLKFVKILFTQQKKFKMIQINTELSDRAAEKLAYIQQNTEQDLNQILDAAIETYYQKLQQENKQRPFQKLEESGFIGCCSVESDLSSNYKSVLKAELETKYDRNGFSRCFSRSPGRTFR